MGLPGGRCKRGPILARMDLPDMTMSPVALSDLARDHDLSLQGPDVEIVTIGALNARSPNADRMLTFLADTSLLDAFDRKQMAAAVVHESSAGDLDGRSLLVTGDDPTEVFYSLFIATCDAGAWKPMESRRGANADIAHTAVIHEGVQIGDDCVIMDNVVILPNSRLGDRVTVKPNATIGGDGFEVRSIKGRRTMVPHRGGVWLGDDVHVGSQTCIDRGMFGSFTIVEDETRIDNLVHVGHSAHLGPRGIVAACTEIGDITAGEGFWLGPQCSVLQHVHLGHHSYVGIGSAIVRDVAPHALAYGNPARAHGWICECRNKLEVTGDKAACGSCGRRYVRDGDGLAAVPSSPGESA